MNDFTFSNVFDTAWEYTKKHGLIIAALLFAISIVLSLVSGVSQWNMMMDAAKGIVPTPSQNLQVNVMSGISGLLMTLINLGVYVGVIGYVKGTTTQVSFDWWKQPLDLYLRYFLLTIIFDVIVVVGLLCCFIPGIYLALRLQFAPIYMLEHPQCSVTEPLKASWRMTDGHVMTLLGLVFAIIVAGVLGVLCCCVGVFFAEAFSMFVVVVAYRMLSDNTPEQPVFAEEPVTAKAPESEGYTKEY